MPLGPSSDPVEHVELRFGRADLHADWRRCALSSEFIAVAACDARYGQRVLSTVVNELMELVWRLGAGPGDLELHVRNGAAVAEITLDVLLGTAQAHWLAQRIRQLAEDPQPAYFAQLGHEGELDPLFGLSQVLCDYACSVRRVEVVQQRIRVVLEVLTRPAESA